jgi:hypothetical protein
MQIAEGVDFNLVPGLDDGGRGVLLDQRRTVDAVAGAQPVAGVGTVAWKVGSARNSVGIEWL